ncbi:organic cation transporter protein-like [Lytechinus pictus]|uniref:organic cation transporter protein-like n=1 Tax=Lytechinus pictus TaxID=7653 RepID=UPI00240D51E4|nr:organic cation transporter protein-like [Lytechinus pictus]
MVRLDDILVDIGQFGSFQKRVFAILCLIVFTSSWQSMITVFLAGTSDHWCAVPQWNDFDCSAAGLSDKSCMLAMKNASIPVNYTTDNELVYAQCVKYNVSGVAFDPSVDPFNDHSWPTSQVIECDDGWVYDRSQYKSSIVTDYDLVCDNGDLFQVSQSVFYAGYLAGSIINGSLADVVGRWWTLMVLMVVRLVVGVALAFSPNWWVFTVLRFFQGYAAISIYIISFIVGTEFVGPSKRNVTGIMFVVPFAIGYVLLAGIAYFVRYWRTLELICASPALIYIVMMFFLPESVRWQISVGRYDKAEKTLAKIADSNNKSLSGPIFSNEFKKEQEVAPKERRATGIDLFRYPRMRLRTINLIFNWMVNAMVYHGLSLNTSNLGVNDYVAFAVSGAVEVPAYLISVFAIEIKVIGRKISLSICLLVGGVACLCTTFIPPGAALTSVAMIGKFGISASFAILYLYTAELYPTNIRSAAMGMCSMFSRISGILAPLILTLARIWTPLPLVIYGSVSVIAGLLTLFLPETLGQKLPETIEEGENFGINSDEDKSSSGKNGIYILNQEGKEDKKDKEEKGVFTTMDYDNPSFNTQDEKYDGKSESSVQVDLS